MHEALHHRPRKAVRPGRRQRLAIYWSSALLLASGLAWLIAHYLLPLPEFAARHPLETWAMRLHGAATLFGLAVFGSLWSNHVLPAWKQGRHRSHGAALALFWLLLILTGYGLYYLSDEEVRALASTGHIALGTVLPLGLAVHVSQARRQKHADLA
ncbi:hypothetical protein [Zoogloea sp.]|uniref:hypothetical protein n=1 Tax=Zoogloea sp. TaxID=49181 RepID=UPI001416480D|nr:MAG: DUF4405 domain-containing protein [Zoogloea sp.]